MRCKICSARGVIEHLILLTSFLVLALRKLVGFPASSEPTFLEVGRTRNDSTSALAHVGSLVSVIEISKDCHISILSTFQNSLGYNYLTLVERFAKY